MKFPAWYSILVGVLMIAQWSFFLAAGAVPERQTEPVALVFHLAAELATAICLVVGGIGLVRRTSWAKNLSIFAAGMLTYTVIVSAGYFAQLGQWPLVGMFAVLLVLDLASVLRLTRIMNTSSSLSPRDSATYQPSAAKPE